VNLKQSLRLNYLGAAKPSKEVEEAIGETILNVHQEVVKEYGFLGMISVAITAPFEDLASQASLAAMRAAQHVFDKHMAEIQDFARQILEDKDAG